MKLQRLALLAISLFFLGGCSNQNNNSKDKKSTDIVTSAVNENRRARILDISKEFTKEFKDSQIVSIEYFEEKGKSYYEVIGLEGNILNNVRIDATSKKISDHNQAELNTPINIDFERLQSIKSIVRVASNRFKDSKIFSMKLKFASGKVYWVIETKKHNKISNINIDAYSKKVLFTSAK